MTITPKPIYRHPLENTITITLMKGVKNTGYDRNILTTPAPRPYAKTIFFSYTDNKFTLLIFFHPFMDMDTTIKFYICCH